ncbi:MAG: Gfo/Idh/MocA family oxidoreductase [Clostridia bacterium]|nr:Gfo/Idh/MocA family oxidoreductase [Clostridia bacterium]
MDKKFKVALVGCGVISDNHIVPLLALDGVELVALCDIRPERMEQKCALHGISPRLYTDYERMLKTEELDAVHIATPHYLHEHMASLALELGINVFLEKPMCISTEEIDKLIEAEKKSTATACVCFQNRFTPAARYALELAERDGGVKDAFASLFWRRDAEYYAQDPWRGKWATEGGGVMINQAIHTVDMLCQLLGRPTDVTATTANHTLKGCIEVEDTCEGVIDFEGGGRANFYMTNAFRGPDCASITFFTDNHKVELRLPSVFVDDRLVELENNTSVIGKACYGSGHNDLIELFYEALRCGTGMPVTLDSAQYALRILLGAYRSNDTITKI